MTTQCRNILMTELYHDEKKGITSGSTLTNEVPGTAGLLKKSLDFGIHVLSCGADFKHGLE